MLWFCFCENRGNSPREREHEGVCHNRMKAPHQNSHPMTCRSVSRESVSVSLPSGEWESSLNQYLKVHNTEMKQSKCSHVLKDKLTQAVIKYSLIICSSWFPVLLSMVLHFPAWHLCTGSFQAALFLLHFNPLSGSSRLA